MGLISHYPLNGNADDALGRYDSTANDVTWVDGKLGQAGSFPTTESEIVTGGAISKISGSFSLSYWVYVTGLNPDVDSRRNVITLGVRATGGYHHLLHNNGSIHAATWAVGSWGGGNSNTTPHNSVSTGKWINVVAVIDSVSFTSKIFIDEVLVSSETLVDDATKLMNFGSDTVFLGGSGAQSGSERPSIIIDDVRIYDHALSKREIRDLARAKVIDFPFNKPVSTTENLMVTQGDGIDLTTWTRNSSEIASVVAENGWYRVTRTDQSSGTMGVRGRINDGILVDAETYSIQIEVRNPNNSSVTVGMDWCDQGETNWDLQPHEQRIISLSASKSTYDATFRFMDVYPLTVSSSVLFRHPQVEKKPFATEFVEGSRDGRLFGVYPNTIPTVLDEAVHPEPLDDGYRFDGSSSITVQDAPAVTGDCSVAFWIKPETTSIRQTFYEKGYGSEGTINFETSSNMRYYFGTGAGNNTPYDQLNSPVIPLNQWTHAVIVRNLTTGVLTWFINGEQTSSTTTDFTSSGISNIPFRIGTGYTNGFIGSLRDMRQFAEALSADEVKELYQQRASLDSQGNFYAHMIKEHNEFSFQKAPTGAGHNGSYGLYFSVDKNVVISSGLVRPYFSGNVTFKLYDFDSKVLIYETQEIPVIDGVIQRIQLDIPCKVGVNYWLSPEEGYGNWMRTGTGNTFEGTEDVFTFQRSRNLAGTLAERWYYLFDIYYSVGLSIEKSKTRQKVSEVGIIDGLVAYYPLRTSTKDLSGNGYDGAATGAIPVGGGFDGRGAYLFNSVDSNYIRTAGETINGGSWAYPEATFTFWINPNAPVDNSDQNIITIENTFEIAINNQGSASSLKYASNPWAWRTASGTPINTGEWHFIVYVHSLTFRKLYVDGVEIYNSSESGGLAAGSASYPYLTIGGRFSGTGSSFNGDISNVKIFNRALSPEEIAVEYKRTGPTKMTQHQGTTYIQGEFKEV